MSSGRIMAKVVINIEHGSATDKRHVKLSAATNVKPAQTPLDRFFDFFKFLPSKKSEMEDDDPQASPLYMFQFTPYN